MLRRSLITKFYHNPPEIFMLDVVTLGEAMVLLVPPRTGLLRYATHFERYVAGAESNTAIGLSRLGHRVGWISRVGNDEFGQCILTFLRGEQVDVSQVLVDDEAPTGVFFKERRRADATRVYYYRSGSAASRLNQDDISKDYIRQARCLHITGITPALNPSCRAALSRAITVAREASIPIAFDPNMRLKLWSAGEAREAFREIIPNVDIVLTSVEEAELITGTAQPEEAARALRAMGPERVVVKLGDQGALALQEDDVVHVPPLKVEVVESVGAGDAFNAGFLSGQLRDWDLSGSLRLGNILGALATTVPGDVEGLPDWDEVQSYLGEKDVVAR